MTRIIIILLFLYSKWKRSLNTIYISTKRQLYYSIIFIKNTTIPTKPCNANSFDNWIKWRNPSNIINLLPYPKALHRLTNGMVFHANRKYLGNKKNTLSPFHLLVIFWVTGTLMPSLFFSNFGRDERKLKHLGIRISNGPLEVLRDE